MFGFRFLLVTFALLSGLIVGHAKDKALKLTEAQMRFINTLNKPIPAERAGINPAMLVNSVNVVNLASQRLCNEAGQANKCTNGMFLTFYIGPNATTDVGSKNYLWPTILSDGFKIRYNSCLPNVTKDIGIVGVFQHSGYQQVNAYLPGDVTAGSIGEPYGACGAISGPTPISFNVVGGGGSLFGTGNFFVFLTFENAAPGIYTVNGAGTGEANGYHFNVVTGAYTTISTCNINGSSCPVTTNGLANYLILYMTGSENIQCGTSTFPAACSPTGFQVFLRNTAGFNFQQVAQAVGEIYLGQEQWNVPISVAPGTYTLSLGLGSGGRNIAGQSLTVKLGAGN